MKKTLSILMLTSVLFLVACHEGNETPQVKKYPADVAVAWINLQQKLIKKTPGFSPGVSGRSFGYSGVTLYESVVQGMPGYRSIVPLLGGPTLPKAAHNKSYHWPASANGAMAFILKNLFASTSAANMATIDSLEAAFNEQFEGQTGADVTQASGDLGRAVAAAIFEWSKTDGGHEGYKPQPNTYVPPVGPGLWIPTPPAFAPAALPALGTFRSFVPSIADQTQLSSYPLPAYSEEVGSPFYTMVNELYTISQSLTAEQILTVKTWADLPGNFNGPSHFTNIGTQLVVSQKLKLDEAALLYAKHGIALNDAGISCFKTKYKYNLIRPISYIRGVMGYTTWNSVIATPPHPEFTSAHAVIGKASSVVLESFFGKKFSFVDHTHDALYGPRTYATLAAYAEEGGWSRVLGGIHYHNTATASLVQGQKVGNLVNSLPFKAAHD